RGSDSSPGRSISCWTHLPFLDAQPYWKVSLHTAQAPDSRCLRHAGPGTPTSRQDNAPWYKGVANTRAGLATSPARYYRRATSSPALRTPARLAEAAPARALRPADISASPPEVVGSGFTCAVTRGKSARFPVG